MWREISAHPSLRVCIMRPLQFSFSWAVYEEGRRRSFPYQTAMRREKILQGGREGKSGREGGRERGDIDTYHRGRGGGRHLN